MADLPAWVQAFNKGDAANRYAAAKWMPIDAGPAAQPFRILPSKLGKSFTKR